MTPTDDVFRLIQALSSVEKQALTAGAKARKKGGMVGYVKLYQALNMLDHYDEAEFLASKKGAEFASNYAVRKNELYEKILQVLRSQRQSSGNVKPIEFQVREKIEDARILREKKCFQQSIKRLQQARKEARRFELHEILLEVLRMMRTVILDIQAPNFQEQLRNLHAEIAETTAIIHDKYRMFAIRDELFVPMRRHRALTPSVDRAALDAVMQAPELLALRRLSFEAEYNYYFCHAMYHHLIGEPKQAWIHFRAIYIMWQGRKEIHRTKALEYRNMIQNYLSFCNDALRFDDFEQACMQLKAGPFHTEEAKDAAHQNEVYIRLQRHLNLCEWEKAEAIVQEFKDGLEEHGERILPSRMMALYLSFSRLFMATGDWRRSLDWAKKVIVEGSEDGQEGLVLQARMQVLIACHELGEVGQLQDRARAAQAAIATLGQAALFESAFVEALKLSAKDIQHRSMVDALRPLLADHSLHNRILKAWIRAKVEQLPLTTVLMRQRDELLNTVENPQTSPPPS